MNSFSNQLQQLANKGEQAYRAVPEPAEYASEYVRAVRSARRERAGGIAALTAVLAIFAAGVMVWPPGDEALPAHEPGQRLWSLNVGAEVWGAPAVVDELTVVATVAGTVHGLDSRTGSQQWTVDVGGPVRADVVAASVGKGADATVILLVASDDGNLTAINHRGEILWQIEAGTAVRDRDVFDQKAGAPIVIGTIAMIGGRDQLLRAFDLRSGEEVWIFEAGAPVAATGVHSSSPPQIFFADLAGFVSAYGLTDGERHWRADIGDPIFTSPVVAQGVVVSGSRGTALVGLDADTGEELWRSSTGTSWAEASLVTDGALAYSGSSNAGLVMAINPSTGEYVWTRQVGGWPWARPAIADGVVYASTAGFPDKPAIHGTLVALDAASGEVLWASDVGGSSTWSLEQAASGSMASPAIGEGTVVVAALDGTVAAFAR